MRIHLLFLEQINPNGIGFCSHVMTLNWVPLGLRWDGFRVSVSGRTLGRLGSRFWRVFGWRG